MIAGVLLAFLLSSCASTVPWKTPHQQNYAGISAWRVNPSENCPGNVDLCYDFEVLDGKEKGSVSFEITRDPNTGVIHVKYAAGDVRAFEGQNIRAQVELAQLQTLGQIIPALTDAIVSALSKSLIPLP